MMRRLLLRAATALAGLISAAGLGGAAVGCDDCRTVEGSPPVAEGTITYKPGDQQVTFTSAQPTVWEARSTALTLHARLGRTPAASSSAIAANEGDMRFLSFEIPGLKGGTTRTITATDGVQACILVRNSLGAAATAEYCLPFSGTADVKILEVICWEHESGVGRCAHNVDATIRGKAVEGTTTLDVDVHVSGSERWVDSKCK